MTDSFNKIKTSFISASRGEEDISILIRYWGIGAYITAYLIFNNLLIRHFHKPLLSHLAAGFCVIYFLWHFYAMIKSTPKGPVLTKEEKRELRQQKRKEFFRSFWRKLLLQESFGTWDPIFVTKLVDVFCIAHFVGVFLD